MGSEHRVVVLGASCGKSALLRRYIDGGWEPFLEPTVEDFYLVSVDGGDGESATFRFLDTAGDHIYQALEPGWIEWGDGFVIAFSNKYTLWRALETYDRVIEMKGPNTPIVFAATCVDNPDTYKQPRLPRPCYNTSALTGRGVDELFAAVSSEFEGELGGYLDTTVLDSLLDETRNLLEVGSSSSEGETPDGSGMNSAASSSDGSSPGSLPSISTEFPAIIEGEHPGDDSGAISSLRRSTRRNGMSQHGPPMVVATQTRARKQSGSDPIPMVVPLDAERAARRGNRAAADPPQLDPNLLRVQADGSPDGIFSPIFRRRAASQSIFKRSGGRHGDAKANPLNAAKDGALAFLVAGLAGGAAISITDRSHSVHPFEGHDAFNILKEGVLYKSSKRSWGLSHGRWFVLIPGALCYYKDRDEAREAAPRAFIAINRTTEVALAEDREGFFTLTTPSESVRSYRFSAKTNAAVSNQWVSAIRAEIERQEADVDDALREFGALLLAPDRSLFVNVLCNPEVVQASETDKIAMALIKLNECYGSTIDLVEFSIRQEVGETLAPSTLFRRNCLATKVMSAFGRRIGFAFLQDTIKPALDHVLNDPSITLDRLEVDPQRHPGINPDDNAAELQQVASMFLFPIINSWERCTPGLRRICRFLRTVIVEDTDFVEQDPRILHSVVGGFIFLRFFCPAIVAPSTFHVLAEIPPRDKRRVLILVSKLMQNLANGIQFGSKEACMTVCNSFITNNQAAVEEFFDNLAGTRGVDAADNESGANDGGGAGSSDEEKEAIARAAVLEVLEHLARKREAVEALVFPDKDEVMALIDRVPALATKASLMDTLFARGGGKASNEAGASTSRDARSRQREA